MPANLLSNGSVGVGALNIKGFSQKVARIPINNRGASEVNTGVKIPALAVVDRVMVDIDTVEATGTTKTISVGTLSTETGGVADGFLYAVSTATATIQPGAMSAATPSRGSLLREFSIATGTAQVVKPYVSNVERTISYTLGSAHTELKGEIFVIYNSMD